MTKEGDNADERFSGDTKCLKSKRFHPTLTTVNNITGNERLIPVTYASQQYREALNEAVYSTPSYPSPSS